ncbi:MAG: hypothetical protein IJ733_12625 [Lachnospiraceae bacterium]|nr:hypothetical protein [Lachnospiraceae bacterium]
MKQHLFEMVICILAAITLMIVHELAKILVYMGLQKKAGNKKKYHHSIWAVYRYIDPIGVILSVTSQVVLSKPFMFRIQNKKYNRILGCTGFLVLFLSFFGSIYAIKMHAFGVSGMNIVANAGFFNRAGGLYIQYMALLSVGMFLTNLFPVSTFDMGLLIAGFSSKKYLGIIKMDSVIKLIYVLALLVDLFYFSAYKIFQLTLSVI